MYINIEENLGEKSRQVEWVGKDGLFVGKSALESLKGPTEFEDVSIKYRDWLRENTSSENTEGRQMWVS